MNEELGDLYRELILDHARAPRHFGHLASATHEAEGINPLCGDKLHLYVDLIDERIAALQFVGSGCAISVASASLLCESLVDTPASEAAEFAGAVVDRLAAAHDPAPARGRLQKLQALDGVRNYPSRVKCATLAWHTLRAALGGGGAPVTTE